MPMMCNEGYLYIATGKEYIDEAVTSVQSLRKCNPDIHATLITNRSVTIGDFDRIEVIGHEYDNQSGWKSGVLFKVLGLKHSPYQKTFFVDTDTYFSESCEELFKLLDFYDILIAHSPGDVSKIYDKDNRVMEGYATYNTGVIAYRQNHKVEKLLNDWLEIYKKKFDLYPQDQPPFMEALLYNDIRLYVLQSNYNFRFPYFASLPGVSVKIFHGRTTDFKKLESAVNQMSDSSRVWNPITKKMNSYDNTFDWRQSILAYTPNSFTGVYRWLKSFMARSTTLSNA